MSKNIFITATSTDIGKTYISSLIVKKLKDAGLSAGYYKAAVSGNNRDESGKIIPGDCLYIKKISGISQPLDEMCPFVYENAVSPHLASKIEGNPVSFRKVMDGFYNVSKKYSYVTLEGSGGIICPLRFDNEKIFLEDFIKECKSNCIIVASAELGTINSVYLTAYYMKKQNINIKGIIYNRYKKGDLMMEDNIKMCEKLTKIPTLAIVEENAKEIDIDIEKLLSLYE